MRRPRSERIPEMGRSSRPRISVATPSRSVAPRSIICSARASSRHQRPPSTSRASTSSAPTIRTSQRIGGRVEADAPRCDAPPVASPEPVHCPFAERCPGCAWIALPPAGQLRAKQALLERALAPYAALEARVLPVQAAEPLAGYRTRAKLAVAPGPRLGLFARGTHDVLDLPGCPVLAPGLASAA